MKNKSGRSTIGINRMDIEEFKQIGFLQEANRLFFHPLGLALEVEMVDGVMRLGGIWDYRDDPEGMIFDEGLLSRDKMLNVEAERMKHAGNRISMMGNTIQQVDYNFGR